MTRKPKVTFVGPVYYQTKKNPRGGHGAEFRVLQDAGALKLEYASMNEALSARRALLSDHHSYSVPSNKLLSAIQEALQQTHEPTTQEPVEASLDQDNDVL